MIIVLATAHSVGLVLATNRTDASALFCLLLGCVAALAAAGVVAPGAPERRIQAGHQRDDEGNPKVFTLTLGGETVTLDPGKPWFHVDHYKWVTRGLIEEPQSFHILRDATVEINGEKIQLSDPDGLAKLELEINKHHAPVVSHKPAPASHSSPAAGQQLPGQDPAKVHFKVRLDRLGHLMIECAHGAEKVETGLRGLSTLIQNGVMLKPGNIHLDPLQRHVEIDGVRFESNEAGAQQLQAALNTRYAPTLKAETEDAVEIRENRASPTGFDIHFATYRVGARFDVKGHLTQQQLDILQDPVKCNLLQRGIILRLSPPHLLVRRKRPDGGEERVPQIADLNYLRATAPQLQQFLNHHLIRKTGGPTADGAPSAAPAATVEPSVTGSPTTTDEPTPTGQTPVPVPTAKISTAPDGTKHSAAPNAVDRTSATSTPPPATEPETPVPSKDIPSNDRIETPTSAAASGSYADAKILALFSETDPLRINAGIFRRLADRFGVRVQDLALSLPRVFTDRRFEIISFSEQEIGSVLELRSAQFYGFYLSHISEQRTDLVYACRGTHLEWGTDKCAVQPAIDTEVAEFKGSALLGMGQNPDNQFVFVVTPAYKQWVRPYEARCREAFAHFLTVTDFAANPDKFTFIWPERASPGIERSSA